MTTHGQAVQDKRTKLGAAAAMLAAQRETVIAQWIATGLTREQAWRRALGGAA